MFSLALAAVVAGASFAEPSQFGLPKSVGKTVPGTWVFFTVGSGDRSKFSPEDIQKMQADHVGNLGTLYNAGICPMAGPTGDANPIRGIVYLKPRTAEELKKDFAPDPFVQHGFLKVESFEVVSADKLLGKAIEPFEIVQNTIVLIKAGADFKDLRASEVDAHRSFLDGLRKDKKLGFFASAKENAMGVLGILILPISDVKEVQKLAESDPAVSAKRVVWHIHPQWMGKGLLKS